MKYKHKKMLFAYLFLAPWLLGFIFLFATPLVNSLIMSFNNLKISALGTEYTNIGFANYVEAWKSDENFLPNMITSLSDLLINVPIILVCSFFFAIILKQKFRGNTFMKIVFFLPVVLGAGVFATYQTSLMSVQSVTVESAMGEGAAALSEVSTQTILNFMSRLGIPQDIISYITTPIDRIYSVISLSGVQTFIFLTALNSISPSLYEAAHVEGASGWEAFWKITLPMVSPMILVNVIYSVVDTFANTENVILSYIYDMAFTEFNFGLSSAMAWVFFVILAVIVGLVSFLVSKKVVYQS